MGWRSSLSSGLQSRRVASSSLRVHLDLERTPGDTKPEAVKERQSIHMIRICN